MDNLAIPNLSLACSNLDREIELSAWYGHIPFAFWIVSLLKPKIVVELGTQNGISYSSFCESIKKNNLSTTASAVDTWKGDPHAGYYGEEVYSKFKDYHDQHYREFSTLLRMTFDEAVHQFSDQSIDLLHIDGLHAYEAVKHDFEIWLPKLSKRAVVLFHDTCVYENNFGVYQLWEELTAGYPGFNFTHSHGLGVLLVGRERHPFLKELAGLESFQASSFNQLFQKLGDNYELTYSLHKHQLDFAEQKKLIEENQELVQRQAVTIQEKEILLTKKEQQLQTKDQELAQNEKLLKEQQIFVTEKERQLSKLNEILDNHKNIYNSFSWKSSLPLRSLEGLSKKAVNRFRKHKLPLKTYKLGLVIFLKHARSGVFDGPWYLEQNRDVKDARWNPFLHFLLYGMYEGRAPNATFDIANYIEEKSDVKTNDISPVLHFMQWGENEERNAYRRITKFLKATLPFPEDKQVVLVFGHEATRTGAPIALLGIIKKLSQEKKFHFITVLKRGGALLSDYQNVCPTLVLGDASGKTFKSSAINTKYFEWIAAHLDSFKGRITCLCSTVDSKEAVAAFGERNFGIISLIYEMPTSINKWFGGAATMEVFDQYSHRLIFPSSFTHGQILQEYKINDKRTRVIHLGIALAYPQTERLLLREKILSELGLLNNTVLVVGCGAYDYRKGFDLFIKTGEKFIYNSINKNQPVPTFLWVGTYFGCDYAAKEISKIPEDIRKHFFFLDERPSVEEIIAAADVFFLSSREDPFPLVALIAAGHGVPILLFSGATGIEHALPQQSYYVASSLDVHVACAALTKALEQVGFKTCSKLIREEFSPEIYAKKIALELDSLKLPLEVEVTAVENNVVHKDLYHVAASSRCFSGNISNRNLFKGKVLLFKIIKYLPQMLKGALPKTEGVKKLSSSIQNSMQKIVPQSAWEWPCDYGKKPIPEFHPGIYKEEYMSSEDRTDPFAHFLQAGRPQGRWNSELLSIKSMKQNLVSSNLRIGLHLHVFYGDLLSDIIRRLEANEVRPDLLITIPNSAKDITGIREMLKKYPAKVEIRITPNKGRDIGAFLTEFGPSLVDEYDIIGHVHTKKSIHATTDIAKKWREFLLENLLGGRVPMADVIIGTMTQEEKIGLVFPGDPYTNGWDKNRSIGKKLLSRLGINKFHEQFNFPVGTMFWARTQALKPLLDLNLNYEDYPEEPMPIDGTILHALERILPFVIEKEKYQIKMTHVEGVTR
ncbi:MAG: class I SAM-dependent methyltransferase [Verrucomicrobiae bacterium]|nr:class I SAM-dependent methyltransferase [Verrucomicrobiae bacterium]